MATRTPTIKFTREDEWKAISRRFCRFHALPHGSEIKVAYKKSTHNSKSRIQKNNTHYRRAVFNSNIMPRAEDSQTIRTVIDQLLLPYIDINLKHLRADIEVYGPGNVKLDTRMLVRSWREMEPEPTANEIEAKNALLQEIDEIADDAATAILNFGEFRWNPEDTVPRAVIRGLIAVHGSHAARLAIQQELGKL